MGGLERRDATGRQDASGVDSTCAVSICRYYSHVLASESWAWRCHLNESYNTSICSLPSTLPLLSTSASSPLRRISIRPTPEVGRRFLRSTTHTQVLHAKLLEGVRAIRREHLGRPGELVDNLSGGGRVDRTSAVLQEGSRKTTSVIARWDKQIAEDAGPTLDTTQRRMRADKKSADCL